MENLLSAKWYPFLFDFSDKADGFRTIFFYLTIVFALCYVLCLFVFKQEKRAKFLKVSLPVVISYAFIVSAIFLYLGFKEDSIVKILFYPLLICLIILAFSLLILCFKRNKAVFITSFSLIGGSFIAVLICMGVYFSSGASEEFNGLTITQSENFYLYLSSILLVALLGLIYYLGGKTDKSKFDSKSISFAALSIAMSFALSYIRIVKLPQGGSITLCSLLPLCIYSYMFGVKKGIFAGLIYGILQAIQDPWIVHPMQFMLDYPIAFAGIGLSGILKNLSIKPQLKFCFGSLIAGTFRFVSHILSGVFAFSEYAYSASGEPMNAFIYSITYNSFVFIDIAITIVVGFILLASNTFSKQVEKINQSQA